MSNNDKKNMKVSCYINDDKVFNLTWDDMPNIGMSFNHEKKEYLIIKINDSKIQVKDITKNGSKKK